MKRYTDVHYEVVSGPTRERDLPRWFKTLMYVLATLFMLALPIWRFNVAHSTASQAEAGATAAPQSPDAR